MSRKSIKKYQTIMNIAMIVRLVEIALLAFNLAKSYSYEMSNLLRMYSGIDHHLLITIAVILLDLILTILWSRYEKINKIHLILYIIFGGIFFIKYMIISFVLVSEMSFFNTVMYAPGLWLLGLIPFIIYIKAKSKLMIARMYQGE